MNVRMLTKTSTYWICHVLVASGLIYALTGQLSAALGIGLLEPSVQAVVFLLHERLWEGAAPQAPVSLAASVLAASKV
jgi:uncharacterized membrane protein